MKKLIFTIAILFSLFSVVVSSCSKDDDDDSPLGASGTYKLVINGNIHEGTATKVIFGLNELQMQDSDDDIVITMDKVPESNGGVNSFKGTGKSQFHLSGSNILESGEDELYFAFTGSVTRTSGTKISFEGTCAIKPSAVMHSFSGYVESDSFKLN